MWRASTGRGREYPGGDSDSNGYRRLHGDHRPPDRGEHLNRGGRPPDRGGHLGGGPLMEEDPLDLLEDKDHQVLKDLLGL